MLVTGNDGGNFENTGFVAGVLDDLVLRYISDVDTNLMTVHTTPDKQLSVFSACERVVNTTLDLLDAVSGQAVDNSRLVDIGFVLSSALCNTGLGKVVQAPGPDVVSGIDCEAVVGAAGYISDFVLRLVGKAELSGNKGSCFCAFDCSTSELALLAGAPTVGTTVMCKSHDVICASCDVSDIRELVYFDWVASLCTSRCESDDTFVTL